MRITQESLKIAYDTINKQNNDQAIEDDFDSLFNQLMSIYKLTFSHSRATSLAEPCVRRITFRQKNVDTASTSSYLRSSTAMGYLNSMFSTNKAAQKIIPIAPSLKENKRVTDTAERRRIVRYLSRLSDSDTQGTEAEIKTHKLCMVILHRAVLLEYPQDALLQMKNIILQLARAGEAQNQANSNNQITVSQRYLITNENDNPWFPSTVEEFIQHCLKIININPEVEISTQCENQVRPTSRKPWFTDNWLDRCNRYFFQPIEVQKENSDARNSSASNSLKINEKF